MGVLAGAIIADVRSTLLDPSPGTAWTDTELYSYLSAGLLAAANIKRDLYPRIGTCPLIAGSIQLLSQLTNGDGLQLMAIYFNTTSGNAITEGALQLLNQMVPAWRAAANQAVDVTEYFDDARSPLVFHVTPPNNGSGNVTMLYGAVPPVVATSTDPINVPDVYRQALWAFTCASAFAKNSRRQDLVKADAMFQVFERWMSGGKVSQREIAMFEPSSTAGET